MIVEIRATSVHGECSFSRNHRASENPYLESIRAKEGWESMPGRIANRERLRQVKDFRGLQFGSISPTDVDAFLEFGDRLFLFVETKRTNATLKGGQLLALRRLCDACQAAGREAVLLITRHDSDGDIDLASTHVEKLWHRGRWHTMKGWTLREAVEYLREKHGG